MTSKKKNNSHKATPPKKVLWWNKSQRKRFWSGVTAFAILFGIGMGIFTIWSNYSTKAFEKEVLNNLSNIGSRLDSKNPLQVPDNYDEIKKEVEDELVSNEYVNPEILLKMGTVELSRNNNEGALHFYEVANSLIESADTREDSTIWVVSLGNLGVIYNRFGKIDKALNYQNQALSISRKIKDSKSEAIALGNIGVIYFYKDKFDSSLQYHRDAFRINHDIKNYYSEALELGNIGNLFYNQEEPDSAIKYHKDALTINRGIPDSASMAYDLKNIGYVFNSLDNFDSALVYLKLSLKINQKLSFSFGVAEVSGDIGLIYLNKDELDSSLVYLQMGLSHSKNKFQLVEGKILYSLSFYYKEKNDLRIALKHIEDAKKVFLFHKVIPFIRKSQSQINDINQLLAEEESNN